MEDNPWRLRTYRNVWTFLQKGDVRTPVCTPVCEGLKNMSRRRASDEIGMALMLAGYACSEEEDATGGPGRGEKGGLSSDVGGVVGGVDADVGGEDAPRGLKLKFIFILRFTGEGERSEAASSGRNSGVLASGASANRGISISYTRVYGNNRLTRQQSGRGGRVRHAQLCGNVEKSVKRRWT